MHASTGVISDGALRAELERFIAELNKTDLYDDEQGYSYWLVNSNKLQCGTCTNSAQLVADRFGGSVFGYPWSEEAEVSPTGHDFAVVGPFLVDWWAVYFAEEAEEAVLHLVHDKETVRRRYGRMDTWVTT